MKKTYTSPLFEEIRCEVESLLAQSKSVTDGALTYYVEEDNEFA